jgi:hypothetical protein
VTAAGLQTVTPQRAEGPAWAFSLDVSGCDRRSGLTAGEAAALAEIGPAGLRRSRARGTRRSRSWQALTRLAGPADQAAAVLHHDRSDIHLRAGAHATGIILQHCADTRQAYWAWTSWDWARLAGSGSREFLDSQALPTEKAVRPFLVALAYLLAGFTDFHHLGMFSRLHVAQLVFGAEAVDAATGEATAVLDRWGYRSQVRDGEYKLPGVLGPGTADQPQPSPGRPDHRGVHPAALPPRGRQPPAASRRFTRCSASPRPKMSCRRPFCACTPQRRTACARRMPTRSGSPPGWRSMRCARPGGAASSTSARGCPNR